jgi:hypothetical protein
MGYGIRIVYLKLLTDIDTSAFVIIFEYLRK